VCVYMCVFCVVCECLQCVYMCVWSPLSHRHTHACTHIYAHTHVHTRSLRFSHARTHTCAHSLSLALSPCSFLDLNIFTPPQAIVVRVISHYQKFRFYKKLVPFLRIYDVSCRRARRAHMTKVCIIMYILYIHTYINTYIRHSYLVIYMYATLADKMSLGPLFELATPLRAENLIVQRLSTPHKISLTKLFYFL